MKAFMLGWEFPPFISGGLGTACHGLTRAMDKLGIQITFVLPKSNINKSAGNLKILSSQQTPESVAFSTFKNVTFQTIASTLKPYVSEEQYRKMCFEAEQIKKNINISSGQSNAPDNYSGDMLSAIYDYAAKAAKIAGVEQFDIVHAHDWMTYPAGIAVSQTSGKPLVVHVHSTEFDRSGEHVNQIIYDIERLGMHQATKVIAVSNYTKNLVVRHYSVPPEKVEVVHNAVEFNNDGASSPAHLINKAHKTVLFLGRITMQKGPEYFLAAAKKVLEVIKDVRFIMAGNGDMMHRIIELAANLGIGNKVFFTGFLNGQEVNAAYQMADLYVMPSVSEPFGIAPLEAMRHNVPVLISKQSGVAETVANALKVDFWDINEMANKMAAVLKRPALHVTLCKNGFEESQKFRWENAAVKVKRIYEETVAGV